VNTFSFQSDLANTLFDTPADPAREQFEVALVEEFLATVTVMTSRQIFQHAPEIDRTLLSRLSGRNFLAVAKVIEMRAPSAIETMRRLRKAREHAQQAAELAKILSPEALDRVIRVLKSVEEPPK
jgi:hypothetical protein